MSSVQAQPSPMYTEELTSADDASRPVLVDMHTTAEEIQPHPP